MLARRQAEGTGFPSVEEEGEADGEDVGAYESWKEEYRLEAG